MYLDPNSPIAKKAAQLRAEEMSRLFKKFTNLFRRKPNNGDSK